MIEFMHPLAVGKERQKHSSSTTGQSVTHHSVNQPPITSLPEHCNHLHKQHPQSSIIRANHASRWLVYVPLPCSRRACTKSSSASSSPHISLHHTARTDQQQEQHKPNESHQRQTNTAKEHSCVQQQVAVSKKRWCSKPLAHQLTAY